MAKRDRSIFARLVALLAILAFVAVACGGSDDKSDSSSGTKDTTATSDKTGGEIVDLGTFQGDPPEHIDPALNSTLDAYQVINELYDGLTDIDATDPANPKIKPLVAESYESNADATVWTFKIRKGQQFSNGEAVLPSSFQLAWERASNPDFAGDYSYLFNFIKGGAEKLDGSAKTISGIKADDAAMTLEVTLAKPYSNFDAVAGFQIFSPMPKAAAEGDPKDWENGLMIGNGAYKLAQPRSDEEIVLVKNDKWAGDVLGNKKAILDKVTFKVVKDVDSGYNAFEAGEGDTANIPPGRVKEADENYGTTLDTQILGSYHYDVNQDDPSVGGPKNLKLREAFSMAIDRDKINKAVFDSSRTVSTGVTPPGIPGFKKDLCGDICKYDPAGAKKLLEEWKADGNKQAGPIKIQFNADNGHEPVIAIMVENLKAVGIDAVADPKPSETYFSGLAKGGCVVCRAGWFADYPTYDNFMYDLFHKDAIGGNNYSHFNNEQFNSLVDEAKQTVDKDKQGDLFNQAETILLKDVGVIPLLWYRGDYVYNDKKFTNFSQSNFGLILWDQIRLK